MARRPSVFQAALTALLIQAGSLGAAEFIFNPVLSGPAGQDLDIPAAVSGADSVPNVQVRLYYRRRGAELYDSVVMGGALSSLDAVIPGDFMDTAGVEYYLEADAFQGGSRVVLATYPASNPQFNPVEVAVRRDLAAPQVTPLSPLDGDSVDSSTPVISASFQDPSGDSALAAVTVSLDGRRSGSEGLQVYENVMTYMPSDPLADGVHRVTVTVTNRAGHSGTATWSFKVGAGASASAGAVTQPWVWDGGLSLETQYGAVLKQPALQTTGLPFQPYGANQATLSVNGHGPSDTLSLKIYETDQDRSDQQPLDRYTATWSNREGSLSLGDVSPSFSELSLYDLYELRGLDFNLLSGSLDGVHTRFEGVWGQTERAVEAGALNLTNTLSIPTYAQYLYGARWEAGDRWFQWGLNSVTVNDDASSLSNPMGVQPQYNTVETSDLKVTLPALWLTLSGEAGVDAFAVGGSLLGLSAGSGYQAGLLWDARPWGSRLSFEWRDLGGGFGLMPGGFSTMANPGLQSDYRGFEGSFSQSLLSNRLTLTLDENHWRDNLDLTLPTTTTTNYFNGMAALNPGAGLPSFNLAYTQTNVSNDGVVNVWDALGNTQAQYVNQLTEAVNAGVGYARALGAGNGSLNLNYTGTDLTDLAPWRDVQNIQSWNVVLAAFYGQGPSGFNGTLGVGGSTDPEASQPGAGWTLLPASNSNDLSAGLHWTQQWGLSPLSTNVGWDKVLTNALTDAGAVGAYGPLGVQVNDNDRDTFSVGGSYRLSKAQKVGLQLSYSLVYAALGTGAAGTATAYDSLSELYCDLRYDATF